MRSQQKGRVKVPKPARKTKLPTMSLDEFLEWDDGTDMHYERYDGRPVAMGVAWPPHAHMRVLVACALKPRLRDQHVIYAGGIGVIEPGDSANYRVPDLIVSRTHSANQWIEAPVLIVEILAPAKRVDVGEKLAFYADMQTVDEILLPWVDKRRVDLWQRRPDGWTVRTFIGSSSLRLRTTDEPIPLDELFVHFGL